MSWARIVGTSRTSGQFRKKEVVRECSQSSRWHELLHEKPDKRSSYVRPLTPYGSVYAVWSVSPKDKTALRLEQGLLDALREIRAKEGIPVTTQIEFAIRDWLKKKGVHAKPQGKRGTPGRFANPAPASPVRRQTRQQRGAHVLEQLRRELRGHQ